VATGFLYEKHISSGEAGGIAAIFGIYPSFFSHVKPELDEAGTNP
jgi:hypothetical protein